MTGTVAFLPGLLPCQLCESEVARLIFEGLWICENCAAELEPRQPPSPPPRLESEESGARSWLEDALTVLSGERG